MEVWKTIPSLPNYEASTSGRVRHKGKEPRKLQVNKRNGYVYIPVRKDMKFQSLRVHRLIAEAFIPNPENKPHVNHIDGNKQNNSVENLEWCTQSENELHKCRVLGKKNEPPHILKPVIDLDTGIVYESIKAAAQETGIDHRKIGEIAAGKRKTCHGKRFSWA